MSYWRFFAMIITSTVVMFGLMYLNTYAIDHVFFSETRSYMALYMGAVMAVIMLAFMKNIAPKGGMGTLISTMLPFSIIFSIVWTIMLLVWVAFGIPLGPDGHLVYPPVN